MKPSMDRPENLICLHYRKRLRSMTLVSGMNQVIRIDDWIDFLFFLLNYYPVISDLRKRKRNIYWLWCRWLDFVWHNWSTWQKKIQFYFFLQGQIWKKIGHKKLYLFAIEIGFWKFKIICFKLREIWSFFNIENW